MELQDRRVGTRLGRLKLLQDRLDSRMVRRDGDANQIVRLGVDRQPGLRNQTLQEGHGCRRVRLGERVPLYHGRGFGRVPLTHLGQCLGDQSMLRVGTPCQQFPGRGVVRHLRAGSQFLQLRHENAQRRGASACRSANRVGLEVALGRGSRRQLVERRLDRRMFFRPSPYHQTVALGVEHDLQARVETFQQFQHAGRFGRLDRIDHQHVVAVRAAGRQLVDGGLDSLVLHLGGYGNQTLVLRIHGHFRLGNQARDCRRDRRGHVHGHRIDLQRGSELARFGLAHFLQSGADRIVIGRDRQRHQDAALRVQRYLRVGQQGLKHRQGGVGVQLIQRVGLDVRSPLQRTLSHDLVESCLESRVFFSSGPNHQLFSRLIVGDLRLGNRAVEHRDQRRGGVCSGRAREEAASTAAATISRRRGRRADFDGINIDGSYAILGDVGIGDLQDLLDRLVARKNRIHREPAVLFVQDEVVGREQLLQHFHHRRRVGILDLVDLQFRLLGGCRLGILRRGGHGDRLDYRAYGFHSSSRVGYQNLFCGRQRYGGPVWPQKGRDLLSNR